MAQGQTSTTTNSSTNGSANGKTKAAAPMTPIDAVAKISRILKQLSPADRKRVLDFVDDRSTSTTSE